MSTFKSDSGGYSAESMYGSYGFVHDQKSCTGDSSRLDYVNSSRWWLHRHGLGGEYAHDQLNKLDIEVKLSEALDVDEDGKLRGENQLIQEYYTAYPKNISALCGDASLKHCCSLCKINGDGWLQECDVAVKDGYLSNVDLMDFVSCNSLLLEQSKKVSSELDSHWIGFKNAEPWWQAADKDELASLVSQTSSHHIRNRDCLRDQTLNFDKISDYHVDRLGQLDEKLVNKDASSVNWPQGNVTSVRLVKSLSKKGIVECLPQVSDGAFSDEDGSNTTFSTKGSSNTTFSTKEGSKMTFSTKEGCNTTFSTKEGSNMTFSTRLDSSSTQEASGTVLTRAQLLEALCHSQTRAREAEKMAQEACDEKDHVLNLFFQQASWLFAYRQWLRLLQLETLCLHIRSKNQFPSFTPPSFLPWVQPKGTTLRQKQRRPTKKKTGKHKCHINKCAIAFAVGLSLAGAGLLFGWTIGWLFPAF